MNYLTRFRWLAFLLMSSAIVACCIYWWRLSISHERLRAETLEQIADRGSQLAELQAHHTEALIVGLDLSLRQFRNVYQTGNSEGAYLVARTTMKAYPEGAVTHFSIVDADGHIKSSTLNLQQSIYVGDRDFFTFHQNSRQDQTYINRPIHSRSAGRWAILITRPIIEGGRFEGVAVLSLAPEYLSGMMKQAKMGEHDIGSLLYSDGTFMARNQNLMGVLGKAVHQDRPLFAQGALPEGVFRANGTVDNTRRIYAWHRLDNYPLMAVIGIHEKTALSPVEEVIVNARDRVLWGTAIFLGLAGGLSLLLLRAARQQQALQESEIKYRNMVETSNELITTVDLEGRILFVNHMSSRFYGMPPEQCIGLSAFDLICEADRQKTMVAFEQWKASDALSMTYENRLIDPSGEVRDMQWSIISNRNKNGQVIGFSSFARDLTAYRKAEQALLDSREQLSKLFTSMTNGFAIHEVVRDADGKVVDYIIMEVNPAYEKLTGLGRAAVLGKRVKEVLPNTEDYWIESYGRVATTGESANIENYSASLGRWYSVYAYRFAPEQFATIIQDITESRRHKEELERIAYYDVLTNLPNRRLLSDRIKQGTARADRNGEILAVCYLDLDDFKPINDRYGHEVGDKFLVAVAEKLKRTLRADDTLARLGGDEFVILLSGLTRAEEIQVVIDRVLTAITAPVQVDDVMMTLSASIGVALYPDDNVDADTLLRHADQAMYAAKNAGKNCCRIFDKAHDQKVQERQSFQKRLRQALNDEEFVLHYQPKVNLVTGEVIGAEALIRWQHPDQGLLSPAVFLDYLESSDLEVAIGEWVIESVLRQIENWNSAGMAFNISANISADHLLQADFAERLDLALKRHSNVNPGSLVLEILETAALSDMESAENTLTRCRDLGVQISLDDFGTGYSSLTYFRSLPVQILKIDQSFVGGMLINPADFDIVVSVVQLAQTFNRLVIAEGVETLQHGAMLMEIGCPLVQGYGIAMPMPAEQMPDWVEQWRNEAVWLNFDKLPERLQSQAAPSYGKEL